MAERMAHHTETTGIVALIVIWASAAMEWLNENHLAVISLVAIVTGIVTIVSAIFRIRLNKRRVDLYEKEVKEKMRRGG